MAILSNCSPSNKEDAHTLFGFIEKSEEILNCYFQFQVLELT
jgi:hypothetical protein